MGGAALGEDEDGANGELGVAERRIRVASHGVGEVHGVGQGRQLAIAGQGQARRGPAAHARRGGQVRGGAVRDGRAQQRAGPREGGLGADRGRGGHEHAVLGVPEGPVGAQIGQR